jgi:hypothetical protein
MLKFFHLAGCNLWWPLWMSWVSIFEQIQVMFSVRWSLDWQNMGIRVIPSPPPWNMTFLVSNKSTYVHPRLVRKTFNEWHQTYAWISFKILFIEKFRKIYSILSISYLWRGLDHLPFKINDNGVCHQILMLPGFFLTTICNQHRLWLRNLF